MRAVPVTEGPMQADFFAGIAAWVSGRHLPGARCVSGEVMTWHGDDV